MVDTGETSDHDIEAMAETLNDVHAGEIETSTTLAVRPDLVDMEAAFAHVPQFRNEYLEFSSIRSVDWYVRTERISPSGVLGDPTKASAEKGEKMWEIMTFHLVNLIDGLQKLRIDDFHQRRY
jgi:creatinine amidohydrolase